ncbi:MAG: NAD(P)/FAD-dependent oxidoreductase, partial [Pseudonocardia sp.]|nr:NAD(P)/FAD-dependent oxidoreductase [Pseudonocardia sp.]
METVDVVVIGAGPVGENVAARIVAGGLSAVVVEAELVGGECSYWACMPSKAMLRSVHALRAAQRLPGVREAVTGRLDVKAVLARRDDFTSHHDDSSQVAWLDGAGVTLVRGPGRLVGERSVVVNTPTGDVSLQARHAVVLATGTTASIPPVPGLREAAPWTSREVTNADA